MNQSCENHEKVALRIQIMRTLKIARDHPS